jgi:hypothetical protein
LLARIVLQRPIVSRAKQSGNTIVRFRIERIPRTLRLMCGIQVLRLRRLYGDDNVLRNALRILAEIKKHDR